MPFFTPIFTIVAFRMWAYNPKRPKLMIFGINFGPGGISHLAIFTKFGVGGSPRSQPLRQLSTLWL